MERSKLDDAEKKTPGAPGDDVDVERNPDTQLHVDDDDDSLYDDGLDIDKDAGGLAGTRGNTPGIAKP